jgi:hypothetical protein
MFVAGSGEIKVCSGKLEGRKAPKFRGVASIHISTGGGGTRTRLENRLDGSVRARGR